MSDTHDRPALTFRGSRRRLRRIRFRQNWSGKMWLLLAIVAATLAIVVPWLIQLE